MGGLNMSKEKSLFNIGDTLYRPRVCKQNDQVVFSTQEYIVSAREIYTDREDFFYKFLSKDGISEICMSERRFLTTPFKELFASEQEALNYIRKEKL